MFVSEVFKLKDNLCFMLYFYTGAGVGWCVDDELESIWNTAIITTTMFSGILCNYHFICIPYKIQNSQLYCIVVKFCLLL